MGLYTTVQDVPNHTYHLPEFPSESHRLIGAFSLWQGWGRVGGEGELQGTDSPTLPPFPRHYCLSGRARGRGNRGVTYDGPDVGPRTPPPPTLHSNVQFAPGTSLTGLMLNCCKWKQIVSQTKLHSVTELSVPWSLRPRNRTAASTCGRIQLRTVPAIRRQTPEIASAPLFFV